MGDEKEKNGLWNELSKIQKQLAIVIGIFVAIAGFGKGMWMAFTEINGYVDVKENVDFLMKENDTHKSLQRRLDSCIMVIAEMKDTIHTPYITKWKFESEQYLDLLDMNNLMKGKMPYKKLGVEGVDY